MKKKRIKGIVAILIVIVVVAAVGVRAAMPKKVTVTTMNHSALQSTVKGVGTVEANQTIDVYAGVSGQIKEANFDKSDMVTPNDLLVSYDTSKFEDEVKKAEENVALKNAELESVKSNNQRNISNYNQAVASSDEYARLYESVMENMNTFEYNEHYKQLCIDILKKNLESKKLDSQRQSQDLQNQLTGLQSDLQGKIASEQTSGDYKEKIESINDAINDKVNAINSVNQKVTDLEKQELNLPSAEMTNEEYEAYQILQQQLTDIQREWDTSRSVAQSANSQIQSTASYLPYEAGVTIAQTQLDIASKQLDLAQNGEHASVTGVIDEKYVSEGAYVSEGQILYSISDTTSSKVIAQLSKFDLSKVKVGQRAIVKIGDYEHEGEVTKIYKQSVNDYAGKAKIAAEVSFGSDSDEGIIYGIEANVTIYTDEKDDALTIPYAAVYSDDEGDYCYVIKAGAVAKCYIETGLSDGSSIEVLGGVDPETKIITEPMTDTNIGDKVRD